ncbi:MAG: MBL fold metallo-hydrolase [Clostridiales bacterium]|nr:MBL fold metallo-hydrolase [Bacillota bacterium]MDD7288793.1 MBL fold metallo-hydrolase [Clostridiales bacterium]
MKLTFFGAAKAVTGSCHCVEVGGKKILIDCGLQQGKDERDNTVLDFAPNYIDYVIVTHAHIDHSGRIPLLVKQGFQGQIFTTRLTAQLMSIMLRDSAHIQEMDAQWKNQKGKRAGREPVEPLYTVADAEQAIEKLVTFEYGQIVELCEGVKIRFVDAGHLLGSACVEMWLTEDGVERKILFSGDLGNINQPVIRDPSFVKGADYVVMESTYGDRNHEPMVSYTEALAKIIDDTFSKGGNVIIPSFAVGRTQELLYFMREMKRDGMVKSNPNFTVVVDSPLANEATKIFAGDLRGYLDEEALEVVKDGEKLFTFPGLTMTESGEESKMLNMDKSSKVIISASGMCDAGRIRHHLKHNLWREECAIVFVGYQGEGTLGRHLLNGAKQVRLFGEDIAVNATIHNFKGLSSHADRDHLLDWIDHVNDPAPKQVFVVHGDAQVTEIFANTLREKGMSAHAPLYEEVFDLANNKMLAAGVEIAPKKTSYESNGHVSSAYHELESAAMDLMTLIRASKGGSNKDLKKMAAQLRTIAEKWKA